MRPRNAVSIIRWNVAASPRCKNRCERKSVVSATKIVHSDNVVAHSKKKARNLVIVSLRREVESLRVSQPSTSRRNLEPPIIQSSNQHASRYHDPEYRNYDNISNFALRNAIASITMFDGQTSVLQFARECG